MYIIKWVFDIKVLVTLTQTQKPNTDRSYLQKKGGNIYPFSSVEMKLEILNYPISEESLQRENTTNSKEKSFRGRLDDRTKVSLGAWK